MKTMENDSQDANRVAFNQGYNEAVLGMIKDHNNRWSFHLVWILPNVPALKLSADEKWHSGSSPAHLQYPAHKVLL